MGDDHEAMKRETLIAILQSAAGVKKDGRAYRAGEEVRLALYVGEPGNAMVINDVRGLDLAADFLVVDAGAKGKLYLSYEAVHALAERNPDNAKAGGGSVGFE